jgi:hypothetical protein
MDYEFRLEAGSGTLPCRRNAMAEARFGRILGVLVGGSLMFSSTAAVAATAAPSPQVSPWVILTAMSGGAPAAAMCGAAAAAAAAQAPTGCVLPALDAVPPPPAPQPSPVAPVAAPAGGLGISPLLLGLLAIAAGVGIFALLENGNRPNSPP